MRKIPQDYIERCYAGWLGKIIGVRHGAPIEGWSYETIRKVYGEIDSYLVDYKDFAADDDSNGPLFFLRALQDNTYTRDITAEQIGKAWLDYVPFEHGFFWWGGYGKSTEHTAYLNLCAGIPAPRSGSVAQNGAAVAEQIGGQIFIDSWGLAIPNDPALAAEYAGKAASVSHGGNAIYGGQFIAAAISAAFRLRDIKSILNAALKQIPGDCEYALVTRDIMAFYDKDETGNWHACMEHIIKNWGYDCYPGVCHIIPNAAVMMMSMLYCEGSFDKAINICNMAGWDTDCNVANVGAIVGTMVGLDGINYDKWRKPINDFLAASSVVGCLNIMNLPDSVRFLANTAYSIRGETPPAKWADFLKGKNTLDFCLPGSTCAIRQGGSGKTTEDTIINDRETNKGGSLRVVLRSLQPGDERNAYYGTYYRPPDFHDSRYDPAFSPVFYPGQTVSATVMSNNPGEQVALYVLEGNTGRELLGEKVLLKPGKWQTLSFTVPQLDGGVIERAGIKYYAGKHARHTEYFIRDMNFSGKADYQLDFGKERMEIWHGLHREVSQMTIHKGLWDLQDGKLMGTCADRGAAFTGDLAWQDAELRCEWEPADLPGQSGFAFRVKGAARGYGLLLDHETWQLSLVKNAWGYTRLAETQFKKTKKPLSMTVVVKGNRITVRQGTKVLMEHVDKDQPYLDGMAGLLVFDGGHARFSSLSVRVI